MRTTNLPEVIYMGHLFLDIETYAAKGNEASALNPYHPESKVLLIAYNYYDGFQPPVKKDIKPPSFLKEWESNEKDMLLEFLRFLENLQKKDPHLKVHGFNIHHFDLPYLFGRMKFHGLAPVSELHDLLFRPFGTDMMQLSALISDDTRHREQLWGIGQKKVNEFFGIQIKEGTGLDCSRFYDSKDYDKIIDYCTQEFTFEQLLNSFYLYVRRLVEGKE